MNPFNRLILNGIRVLAVLGFSAPFRAGAEIKYVLHITVDGLRGDLLRGLMDTRPADYPNFRKLRDEGVSTFNARCDYDFSETLPNHCSAVTGRPVNNPAGAAGAGHQYNINSHSPGGHIHKLGAGQYLYKVSTFDTAHDRSLTTALYAGKTRLNVLVDSYNATNGRPDTTGVDNGRKKIDFISVADLSAAPDLLRVKNALVADITAAPLSKLRNYSLVHFTDTDTGGPGGGHWVGWGSPAWNGAVKTVDGYLGGIFTALTADGTDPEIKGKVAIILTSDHGGGGPAGPGGAFGTSHTDAASPLNYTIPLFIWGPGIPAGRDAHTLFKNRFDPADGRPGPTLSTPQPLRNADTANIAMGCSVCLQWRAPISNRNLPPFP
ncbi:MAG: alkaline phosphatase family protein [Verrucomicrobiota bacterium]